MPAIDENMQHLRGNAQQYKWYILLHLYQGREKAGFSEDLHAGCGFSQFSTVSSVVSVLHHIQEGLTVLCSWLYIFISLSSG